MNQALFEGIKKDEGRISESLIRLFSPETVVLGGSYVLGQGFFAGNPPKYLNDLDYYVVCGSLRGFWRNFKSEEKRRAVLGIRKKYPSLKFQVSVMPMQFLGKGVFCFHGRVISKGRARVERHLNCSDSNIITLINSLKLFYREFLKSWLEQDLNCKKVSFISAYKKSLIAAAIHEDYASKNSGNLFSLDVLSGYLQSSKFFFEDEKRLWFDLVGNFSAFPLRTEDYRTLLNASQRLCAKYRRCSFNWWHYALYNLQSLFNFKADYLAINPNKMVLEAGDLLAGAALEEGLGRDKIAKAAGILGLKAEPNTPKLFNECYQELNKKAAVVFIL